MLERICEIVFYCIYWLKSCNLNRKQAVSYGCSMKKMFSKTSQPSQVNTRRSQPEVLCLIAALKYFSTFTEKVTLESHFLNKFTWEFCEIFKNNHFVEHLQTTDFETPVLESFFNKTTSLTA